MTNNCEKCGFLENCEISTNHEQYIAKENGPWRVQIWNVDSKPRICLLSDDFTHDVVLDIDGDFNCDGDKLKYTQNLAKKLNDGDCHEK